MQLIDVEAIFEIEKNGFLEEISSSKEPLAIILGGQPASGKSFLLNIAEKSYTDRLFLSINGDLYRAFHPEYNTLIKDSARYSNETQIFSNVFTEKLIEEAINRRCNVIVEGTMRNPDVPLQTANLFKQAGFRVEAYAISAPGSITQLEIYSRFNEEQSSNGVGRLSELDSHNSAVKGLPKSLDSLYNSKAVDGISIYSFLAKEKVKEYSLVNGSWSCKSLPSLFIDESRSRQAHNAELLKATIQRGEMFVKLAKDKDVITGTNNAIEQLKSELQNLQKKSIGLKP